MKTRARWLVAGAALALGLWGLATVGSSFAADDEKDGILKLAGMIEKGDDAAAKKEAAAIAKKAELEDVMHLFKLRKMKGLGIGDTPDAITPDGIEAKFIALTKKPLSATDLGKQADDLAKAADVSAAIAAVAIIKAPEKKVGAKDPKEWKQWAEDLDKGSKELAAAARKKDAKGIQDAAKKSVKACNDCHAVFRD